MKNLNDALTLLIALAPILIPAGLALYRLVLAHLPEASAARVEREVALIVEAVEQTYSRIPGSGEQKKAEVLRLAEVLGLKVDPVRLDLLIEAAVAALPPR